MKKELILLELGITEASKLVVHYGNADTSSMYPLMIMIFADQKDLQIDCERTISTLVYERIY